MYKYVNGNSMKTNVKSLFDEYFTKSDEAKRLIDFAKSEIGKYEKNLEKYLWIDPSAGDGCFYDLLLENKRIGIDINSKRDDIVRCDYLKYELPNKNVIVIGNPPFGNRGVVALEFINHSQNADFVCFILPMFFESIGKGSIKYRIKNFGLLKSISVSKNSFYVVDKNGNKKDVDVKCCFQIWSKKFKNNSMNYEFNWYQKKNIFKDVLEIYTVSTAKNRECGKKWIFDEKANWYIASTFFKENKIVENFKDVKYNSGLAIVYKTFDLKLIKKLDNIFKNADWIRYSSLATNSCRHIGKSHIYQLLNDNNILGIKK